jgi:tetratricopeptide (TPR) repeat protein
VKLAPKNSIYLNTLGILYGQKGSYDEAIESFEAAIRLNPDNPNYRRNLDNAVKLKSRK